MAAKPKSTRELDLRYSFKFRCLDVLSLFISKGIPWGALILIAYWLSGSINSLAGKTTFADIGVAFLGDFSISKALAYALTVGCIGYGLKERRLRRETIDRLHGRIKELELKEDPRRHSSGLTTKGTTRPQDIP